MIKYYLILFVRNLQRQKLFSFIILLGLTVSIASTLLIYLYVRHEFSFDRFHKEADRIYRVNQTFIWGEGNDSQFASTGPGVAYAVAAELPEVELLTSIHTPGDFILSYTNASNEVISIEETKILAVDSNFFTMFNFPIVKGNTETPLQLANTMVMVESTARYYFGDEDPIGKLVLVGNLGEGSEQKTFEITAVVKDIPDNSYIEFDVLLSMNSFPRIRQMYWSWVWTQLETYVRLDKNANIEDTKSKLAQIPRKHAEQTLQRVMNTTFDDYIKSGKKWELYLQPLTSIHLPSETVLNRLNDSGSIKIIYSFIGAAIFIVMLSCVNFMNLSTAQFTRRIKEASVRKILGLGRKELSINYFAEALMFCLIALLAALAFTQLLLPSFNLITGKFLQISLSSDPGLIGLLLSLVLVMALVSSSYPALFLSSFNPVEAIKGKLKSSMKGVAFRNGLVVFQFSVSIILIICTVIVFEQLNYVSEKDLGFDKENLLVINHVEGIKDGETFANAALNISGVLHSSWCTSVPPTIWGGDKFSAEGMNDQTFALNYTSASETFIPTLDIKLKFGRNFSKETPGDIDRVILNETAIKRIGWNLDESIIGKKIETPGGEIKFEVVGVVADFNYWSLATEIEPLAIFHINNTSPALNAGDKQFLALRIQGEGSEAWETTFSQLNKIWKTHAGDSPFQYSFVDQTFAETFKTQQQFGKVLTVMASLAILIASLGLLGMIIYSLEQRSKEIGIRKVSGASVWNILTLISGGYTKLIILAFIIGAPMAYFIMQEWLLDFSYRIIPSVWVFAVVGVGTLIIAILITSYHSIQAALTNPVKVLKDE
ncbi:MAG: ABC transporter permease [Bacteroidia bacterium]|nr:ABC transporter permease [Bacteroidia bacterium]